MATDVDICNLALSHIAQDYTITSLSPSDGSMEASKCIAFYPIARDELLEKHAWRFASRRATLAQLATNPSTVWQYAYALPNLCLRPLAVLLPGETDETNAQRYTVELQSDGVSSVLYTNTANAELKYLVQQTVTATFTPNFVTALSARLAAYLAGAIPRDMKLKAEMYKWSEALWMDAAALDGNSTNNAAYGKDMVPAHLAARS